MQCWLVYIGWLEKKGRWCHCKSQDQPFICLEENSQLFRLDVFAALHITKARSFSSTWKKNKISAWDQLIYGSILPANIEDHSYFKVYLLEPVLITSHNHCSITK
jgi:hypothetical protein